MQEAAVLILLGVCSLEDLQNKKIRTCWLLLAGITGVACRLVFWRQPWLLQFGSLLPGAAFLLLSYATGEKVGKGDAFLILITGIFLGISATIELLCYAILIVSVYALALAVLLHKNKNYQIAFVPFLLLADTLRLIGTCIL